MFCHYSVSLLPSGHPTPQTIDDNNMFQKYTGSMGCDCNDMVSVLKSVLRRAPKLKARQGAALRLSHGEARRHRRNASNRWFGLVEQCNAKKNVSPAMISSSREDIASNPCIPRGYDFASNASDAKLLRSYAVGNFSACKSEVMSLLRRRDICLHPPCERVSSSLVELQSRLGPPDKFFFISEFFGLAPMATLSELEAAGHHYCEDDWYQLKRKYHSTDDLDLLRYCFSSAYVVALLHDSFGIPMTDKR
ncbi:hypothetical protein TEA_029684 [Camellia sinensis var. sinensis]|uniref:Uncharacterized protein n=1 Tax=Camellia sinensis var. sinensis TaxID=542762 RepID=A0A4S4E5M9_CAMSN|nr:hypothetical protein TEA_029684 [Camellia sinensis var. sinensis]